MFAHLSFGGNFKSYMQYLHYILPILLIIFERKHGNKNSPLQDKGTNVRLYRRWRKSCNNIVAFPMRSLLDIFDRQDYWNTCLMLVQVDAPPFGGRMFWDVPVVRWVQSPYAVSWW